ncbi:MAG: helix-turn-helix transcriptional regulator [Gordonia sp. (in: high G+C Gram-positive bacteria)]
MTTRTPHLRELGELLRRRRAELTPADVGLPEHGVRTRRVPGLRREEVAQLVAISTDYYTRVEQGRLAPSEPILDSLVDNLRLDDEQARYARRLIVNAGRRVARRRPGRIRVHAHLERLTEQLEEVPAMVLGPRMEVLAWNALAAALVADFGAVPEAERNYVRMIFLDPRMRTLFDDWEGVARTCVEILRMNAGENPTDPTLVAIVGELSIADEQFRRWWATHRVTTQDFGSKVLHHPLVGDLRLNWDTFRFMGAPDQQMVLWHAEKGTPSYANLRALAAAIAR